MFDTDPIGSYSFICRTFKYGEYSVKYRKEKKLNAICSVISFEVTDFCILNAYHKTCKTASTFLENLCV